VREGKGLGRGRAVGLVSLRGASLQPKCAGSHASERHALDTQDARPRRQGCPRAIASDRTLMSQLHDVLEIWAGSALLISYLHIHSLGGHREMALQRSGYSKHKLDVDCLGVAAKSVM